MCLIAKIGFVKYPEPTAARMDAAMVRTTVRMISCIRLKVRLYRYGSYFNQKIGVLTGVGDRDPNMDIDYMVIAF